MNPITNQRARWQYSMLLGVIAAVGLAGLSPIWMLAQMGGRVPFTFLWFPVTATLLLLAAYISKPGSRPSVVQCGLSFATPVSIVCELLPLLEHNVKKHFGREIRYVAIATLIFSVVIMAGAAWLRRASRSQQHDHNSRNPGTSQDGGTAT